MNATINRRVVELIEKLSELGVQPGGVADDSRQVRPGDLFVAYPGDQADGRKFIAGAIEKGACAIRSRSAIRPFLDGEQHIAPNGVRA